MSGKSSGNYDIIPKLSTGNTKGVLKKTETAKDYDILPKLTK